ncbi:MAG TPA: acyltransferase domain-containing protein [Clostridia bacterium]|nr:acyltransferase domain-containing protein [Clostridia bacterium]
MYPDYVLGASLGEYTACAVAGVISCEYAIQCLDAQAQMLESHCMKGGMLAIINDYRLYDDMPVLSMNSELVSVNYHSHFIVSGSINNLKEIKQNLKAERILFQQLHVSFAFHCRLIDPIASIYKCFLKSITLKSPEVNFISSLTGDKILPLTAAIFGMLSENL